jgi:uncharacterized protein
MKFGRRAVITVAVLAFLLLLVGGRAVASFLAELLWYRSTGYENVFWTHWRAALLVRGAIALAVAVAVYLNLWVVMKSLGAIRLRRRYGNIEIAERLPRGYLLTALAIVALFSAWWLSAGVADPLPALAAINPVQWNVTDPLFGLDVAFYVFRLPMLSRLQTLGALVVFWIGLLAVAAYIATGAIKLTDGKPSFSNLARRHLGLLLATFTFLYAINVWLDRYGLMIDGNGFGGALGYTDVHARVPAKLLIFGLAILAAAAIAYGSWIGDLRLPIAATVLIIVGLVGVEGVYAPSIQRFVVEPNQFPREREYIEQHLAFTRAAYKLHDVEREDLPYDAAIEPEESVLVDRIRDVPLWDPRPLLTTYRQRQGLFRYYTFTSVHHDRYVRGDAVEPVAISVRELETSELEDAAQTWQNLHLNYVAGDGVVVSPVARMAPDGTPIFYVWDRDPPKLAPDAPADLRMENPSIYFGERSQEYVMLEAEREPIGITLDAGWKKLLFAWAFQSKNILLSGDLERDSKIVFRRRVVDRIQAVAPFLRVSMERAAYPVIHEGRVVWIVDAYTASSGYPLAPPRDFEGRGVRYIRNSVKGTVDAVTGEVRLFVTDPEDPILATYMRIFPDLVRPLDEMPEELREHLRYPVQMMDLQAQVLSAYHLLDPRAFYEQQDVWSLATEQYRGTPMTMEPRYAIFPLPGRDEPEFLLSVPFVARGRQNMTALLMTRNDSDAYGEQILYLLPRDVTVPGPQQVEAAIDQDPDISQQLSLWRRGGSDVARGHLIVVPVAGTLVYVEPLFLEAENAAIPQLERVILALGGRVVMESTFESAVAALLHGRAASPESEDTSTQEGPPPPDAGAVAAARRFLEEADAYLRAGDWEGFGRSWEALREALSGPSGAQ